MKTKRCTHCHHDYPPEDLFTFDGQLLCRECFNDLVVRCDHCGELIWREENAGNNRLPLCITCRDNYYTRCTNCERLISTTDAYYESGSDEPLCHRCYNSATHISSIRDYYYKPTPIFYGTGPRYFGVELEVDCAGEGHENAVQVMSVANCDEIRVYCKHDGSLDDGFEVVTHPMTLAYHCNEMPWNDILTCLKGMGYRSHQAGTCGLHCHISRTAFGETKEDQDAVIARVLYFVEKNWEELLKFSRRTRRQLERWATRYGYKDYPKEILDHATKGYVASRYTCINLQCTDTIEFRIFRGTLKLNTLIATLQLIDRICDVALYLSDEELQNLSWTTFVAGCTQPELVQYLKERRLYVNEPVESEDEL